MWRCPRSARDLGFSGPDLQWVVTVYVLLTGGLLLLGGRARRRASSGGSCSSPASPCSRFASLAERAGRRRPRTLIAARAAPGRRGRAAHAGRAVARDGDLPGLASATVARPAWSATAGAGAAVGVVLGGVLTTAASWEWISSSTCRSGWHRRRCSFAARAARRGSARQSVQLDLPGAVLVRRPVLVVLVYAIDGAAGARLGLGPHARAPAASRSRCSPPSLPSRRSARQPLMAPAVLAHPPLTGVRRADPGSRPGSSSAPSS